MRQGNEDSKKGFFLSTYTNIRVMLFFDNDDDDDGEKNILYNRKG